MPQSCVVKNISPAGAGVLIITRDGESSEVLKPGQRFRPELEPGESITITRKIVPQQESAEPEAAEIDIDAAPADQLIEFIKSKGGRAQKNWKLETLQKKARELL